MAIMMVPWKRVKFPRTITDDTAEIENVEHFKPSRSGSRSFICRSNIVQFPEGCPFLQVEPS